MASGSPQPYGLSYDPSLNSILYAFQSGWIAVPSSAFPLTATTLQQIFVPVATDPVSPVEGQVWYNTTSHTWKGYNGTAVKTFTVLVKTKLNIESSSLHTN